MHKEANATVKTNAIYANIKSCEVFSSVKDFKLYFRLDWNVIVHFLKCKKIVGIKTLDILNFNRYSI